MEGRRWMMSVCRQGEEMRGKEEPESRKSAGERRRRSV